MGSDVPVRQDGKASTELRVAAAGDIHAHPPTREQVCGHFRSLSDVDLVLLAGDLTTTGEVEQGRVVADACRELDVPAVAVLGNHDWHSRNQDAIAADLTDAGVHVLQRGWTTIEIRGLRVGVVGTKGFVGGFRGFQLTDFGEPLLRELYAETSEEVAAIERGLHEVAGCDVRIVLLHYAPTMLTLEGEPASIWAFLGSDRMGVPIAEHQPDLVLHGHGHAGSFAGCIGDVPVYNVAVPVTGRAFTTFGVTPGTPPVVLDGTDDRK
jgi:Icc-related predicted phosphoesterase